MCREAQGHRGSTQHSEERAHKSRYILDIQIQMPWYVFMIDVMSVCALLNTHCLMCVCLCAVVALRQVQRQVEREKEQMKDVEKERTEHTHKQITQLQKQLKDKDKDRNLLLVSHTHTHTRTHTDTDKHTTHTLSSVLIEGASVAVLAHFVASVR